MPAKVQSARGIKTHFVAERMPFADVVWRCKVSAMMLFICRSLSTYAPDATMVHRIS